MARSTTAGASTAPAAATCYALAFVPGRKTVGPLDQWSELCDVMHLLSAPTWKAAEPEGCEGAISESYLRNSMRGILAGVCRITACRASATSPVVGRLANVIESQGPVLMCISAARPTPPD